MKIFDYILPSDFKYLKLAEYGYFSLTVLCLFLLHFAVLQDPKIKLSQHYIFYFIVLFSILWVVAMNRVKKLKRELLNANE